MTDVKRLLEGADLPWWTSKTETEHSRRIYAPTDGVNLATTWWDGNPHPTADLIVHAVNTLPAYEAAVEALERLVAALEPATIHWTDPVPADAPFALNEAREALRRVRGEAVPS